MTARQIRVDTRLEEELKYIQQEMKKRLNGIDLSKPKASIIAAKILNERRSKIDELIAQGIDIR